MKIRFNVISNIFKLYIIIIVIFVIVMSILACFIYVDLTANGSGFIMAKNCIDIKAQEDGIIKEVFVVDGQMIEKGQTLLILKEQSLRVKLKNTKTNLFRLKYKVEDFKYRINNGGGDIIQYFEDIQAELDKMGTDYKHLIKKAQKELELMEIEYNHKIDNAKFNLDKVKLVYNKAPSLKEKTENLNKNLEGLEKILEALNEPYDSTLIEGKYIKIQAPISGCVLSHDTQSLKGMVVQSGDSLLRIEDNTEFIIKAKFSEKEIPLIEPGQKAKVQVISFPKGEYQLLSARVLAVSAESNNNSTSTFSGDEKEFKSTGFFFVTLILEEPYRVEIFNKYYKVKSGFSVEVKIITSHESLLNLALQRVLRLKKYSNK